LKVADSAEPVACLSCAGVQNHLTLFCPQCEKIQPPQSLDFYAVFGLRPHFNLDLPALEEAFHRLSRRLHPDRFVRAAEHEKSWSLTHSALLNDAYRTLKDPIARTEYFLKLRGGETGDARHSAEAAARVPADLLEEVFELNLQLEQMRSDHFATEAVDPELERDLLEAQQKLIAQRDQVDEGLRGQWDAWETGTETARQAAEKSMLSLLDRRRYLSNLVRDVGDALAGSDAPRIFNERGR
jgi:molecular chaperone HscB